MFIRTLLRYIEGIFVVFLVNKGRMGISFEIYFCKRAFISKKDYYICGCIGLAVMLIDSLHTY